jgi:Na+/proline symporter
VLGGLPSGIAGLVVAGLLAAAMSTVSSSLNSLASATTHDFVAPLTGTKDPKRLLSIGRRATVVWAVILVALALPFRSTDQPVVEIALAVASITYGSLLGTYMLAAIDRVAQRDAIIAMSTSAIAMVIIVLVKPGPFANLAWPWYVPLGTSMTLVIGIVASGFPKFNDRTT